MEKEPSSADLAASLKAISGLSANLMTEASLSGLPIRFCAMACMLAAAAIVRQRGWPEDEAMQIMREAFVVWDAIKAAAE